MNRDILKVIEEITSNIPNEKEILIKQLKSLESSVSFSPPELIYLRWETLTNIINANIPYPPEEDWQFKVVEIFTNIK